MPQFPLIVLGSYEEFLLGYEIVKSDPGGKNEFKLKFSNHAHQASIRCLDSFNNLLTSSGADEYINIYNMQTMQEVGVLGQHNGTVTSVQFTPDGSHLISGSQDGNIAIFQCNNWKLVKYWKNAHDGVSGVTDLAVHPTGTLLLSIGADNILKTWNLIKGRLAYAKNFSKRCNKINPLEIVKWSDDGASFALVYGKTVMVFLVSTAGVLYEFECKTKISSVDIIKGDNLLIGREDGVVELHSIPNKEYKSLIAHKSRVKCLKCFTFKKEGKKEKLFFISADSTGSIKLWSLKLGLGFDLICETKADCRITCLAIVKPKEIKDEKKEDSGKEKTTKSSEIEVVKVNSKKTQKSIVKQEKVKGKKNGQVENGEETVVKGKKRKLSGKWLVTESSSDKATERISKKNKISLIPKQKISKTNGLLNTSDGKLFLKTKKKFKKNHTLT